MTNTQSHGRHARKLTRAERRAEVRQAKAQRAELVAQAVREHGPQAGTR